MKIVASVILVLIETGAAALADEGNVAFRMISAEQTGIQAVFKKWNVDELGRQGGKRQSHGWWPWGLTAFDFDGDGDLDLLPTHHGRPHGILLKSLLRESGQLAFVNATKESGVDSRDLPGADGKPWIWDFDGDGWLDIAGWSDESKPNSLLNLQGKKFVVIPEFSFHPISHAEEVLDLNGDGYLDVRAKRRGSLLTGTYDPQSRRFRLKDEGDATPQAVPEELRSLFLVSREDPNNRFLFPTYSFTHDLNGDGRPDLVAGAAGAYGGLKLGRYYLGDGQGAYTNRTEELGLPEKGAPVLVFDLTDDGLPEILIGMASTGGLYVNDGKGHFAVRECPLTDFLRKSDPYSLRVWPADFDDDGDMDLVVSSPRYGQEEVHENLGDGRFRLLLKARGWDSDPIVICDIDCDGRLDLVIGNKTPDNIGGITLYLNASKTLGNFANIHLRMDGPNPYAVGTLVEVWKAGTLDTAGARPFVVEKAHLDATPIHVGLGQATRMDLRVTFPGKQSVVHRNVAPKASMIIRPDGAVKRSEEVHAR